MVRIKKISKHELPKLIALSYTGDSELIEKYHSAKSDFNGSIQYTLDMIEKQLSAFKLNYYKVIFKNAPIGYFVTGGETGNEFLYSFAININYRKKYILIAWWEEVKKTLIEEFKAFLFSNNTPAVEFLKKNGMEITFQDEGVYTFTNKTLEYAS